MDDNRSFARHFFQQFCHVLCKGYLDALGEGRTEDGMALLAAPEPAVAQDDLHRELHELHLEDEAEPRHMVWEDDCCWWTDFPPPEGFMDVEEGEYGDRDYRRVLTPREKAAMAEEFGEGESEEDALAEAIAERDRFFGFVAGPEKYDPYGEDADGDAPAPEGDPE